MTGTQGSIRQPRVRLALSLILAATVGACGPDDDARRASQSNDLIVHPDPVTPPEPRSMQQALPDAYATPKPLPEVPQPFRGRYATVAPDCRSADKRLIVGRHTVGPNAAHRAVNEVVALSPTQLRIALAPDPGGEHWRLTLLHDGKTLMLDAPGARHGGLYQRCPA